ncbi:hypothetical protein NLJ89_g3870 [Agrocybe chaxingu]|uniref:Uncharacterized protein n=1 Tax=Agrocybe chaxingu TaxID=84603 RepID=A0A9W8K364_9AGAR|nr:hypothetical protein NLJ89_g3870 [Agrocybe chaxingu]
MPGPQDSVWTVRGRRLRLMLWAWLVPELYLFWAARQRYVARKLKKQHSKEHAHWTVAHGFFLVMGGFHIHSENGEDLGVLSQHCFETLLKSKVIDFPTITKEEIEDRSKADGLTKGIALLQTLWFILQCIARGAQKLALTELEIVTLAVATINIVVYFFWWNKPMDVRVPVTISLKVPQESPVTAGREEITMRQQSPQSAIKEVLAEKTSAELVGGGKGKRHPHAVPAATSPPPRMLQEFRDEVALYVEDYKQRELMRKKSLTPRLLLIRILADLFIIPKAELIGASRRIPDNLDRVPTFYNGMEEIAELQDVSLALWAIFFSTAFGAIHCIAWDFTFPTEAQRFLWRTMSLAVTAIPLLYQGLPFLWDVWISPKLGLTDCPRIFLVARSTIGVICYCWYIAARFSFLIQAAVLLSGVPPMALVDIEWADLIPHF